MGVFVPFCAPVSLHSSAVPEQVSVCSVETSFVLLDVFH